MCFLVSVSQENHAVKKQIDIPVILETILYESAQRKVTVSCDMVVNNKAATPVVLYITHPDDVEGRLATEDWFSPPGVHPDHRATLVCAIYGKTFWAVSPEDRMLEFANPTESSVGSIGRETRLRAKAISRIPGASDGDLFQLPAAHLEMNDPPCPFRTYRLKKYPLESVHPGDLHRPYSSFCVLVPANECVFFRITTIIRDGAYSRLVENAGNATFDVIGPAKIMRRLLAKSEGAYSSENNSGYREFFIALSDGMIEPSHYQVIIGQPEDEKSGNKLVRFRPTNSVIRELHIADKEAREKALWFDTSCTDFGIVLQYHDPRRGERLSRKQFYKRLSPFLTPACDD